MLLYTSRDREPRNIEKGIHRITACLLHNAYTGTPPLALHAAARDQYKSKYSAHTPTPTPDGDAQIHNNNNHLRAAPRAAAAANISPTFLEAGRKENELTLPLIHVTNSQEL